MQKEVIRTLVVAAGTWLGSCGASGPSLPSLETPSAESEQGFSVKVRGRIRDIRPALMNAQDPLVLATVNETGSALEGELRYELVGIRAEGGRINFEFEPADGSLVSLRTDRDITITARLTDFGDAEREKELVEMTARWIRKLAKQE